MTDEQCEDGTGIQHLGYKCDLRQRHSICQSLMTETFNMSVPDDRNIEYVSPWWQRHSICQSPVTETLNMSVPGDRDIRCQSLVTETFNMSVPGGRNIQYDSPWWQRHSICQSLVTETFNMSVPGDRDIQYISPRWQTQSPRSWILTSSSHGCSTEKTSLQMFSSLLWTALETRVSFTSYSTNRYNGNLSEECGGRHKRQLCTRWFKYDRDWLVCK
jgi:hypothetical protein